MCFLIFWTTLIFWTVLRGSQNSSVALSQMMNHGFWSTTPRQNAEVGSDILQTLPVPRKREWANPKSNRCSFAFDSQGIVHMEFVPPGQILNQMFYRKSLKVLGKVWHVCDQALHALGCSTTKTPLSHGSINQWIFGRKNHFCGSSASLFPGSQSLWLRFIPPAQKTTWKGAILVLWIISRRA